MWAAHITKNSIVEASHSEAETSVLVVAIQNNAYIRNDNAAENIDILRNWALNVLQKAKRKPEQSIKSLMRKNAMSPEHFFESVNKIFHA